MKTYINSFNFKQKKILLFGDIVLVSLTFFLAAFVKIAFFQTFTFNSFVSKLDIFIILWILLYPLTFYVFELYNEQRWRHNVRLFVYISTAVVVASGIVALLSYLLIPNIIIGRTILFLHIILSIILIFLWRKIFDRFFLNGTYKRNNILLIGNGPVVNDIESIIQNDNDMMPNGLTIIRDYSENPGTVRFNGSKAEKSLYDMVTENKFSTVIVSERLGNLPILKKHLSESCKRFMVFVP